MKAMMNVGSLAAVLLCAGAALAHECEFHWDTALGQPAPAAGSRGPAMITGVVQSADGVPVENAVVVSE